MKEMIVIKGLAVQVRIGVPDAERAQAQTVWMDLEMSARHAFREMNDEVQRTVDYAVVAEAVVKLGAERERRLIETLASDAADLILGHFDVVWVRVTVRKRILPNTDCVEVILERRAAEK